MFKDINPREFLVNPPTEFGTRWMLLTAGTKETGFNTMTIAWGHMGSIWERGTHANRLPTAICYVRPSRYTMEFLNREPYFTLSSLPEEYRKALGYLGSHSGRDGDKISAAGLTPVHSDQTTYFAEADTVYICRTLYHAPLKEEGFIDRGIIDFNYRRRDFHEMYIGEIIKVLKKA